MKSIRPAPTGKRMRSAGFTLVEIMAALAVSVLLLAAVASVFVGTSKIVRKNLAVDQAVANTRVFQENFVHDVSMAVTSPTTVAPQYSVDSGTTPARSSRITYRTLVGPVAKTNGVSAMGGNTIILTTPAGLSPKTGDYVLCANPDFGAGVAVSVDDQRAPNTQGDVTLTLVGTTIAAATLGTPADIPAGTSITIQRQSAYQTAPSAAYPGLFEMRRYPTTARNAPPLPGDTETYTIISSNLSTQYPFIQVAGPSPSLAEPGIGWQFSYAVPTSSGSFIGGSANYYEANHTEGVMMPKSGDPMNSMGNSTTPPPPCTTTSTSTTSTSTTSTSTSTSISTTTSTSISTTTSTTSTSTTSISTSSTTSTSTVATTTTSVSTTTTTSISTSSVSTTTSTSTAPTTTTSVSTTTTSTVATTTVPTTTSTTTSTTSVPTTTTTTSTSTSSITTSSTTSTIVYDG